VQDFASFYGKDSRLNNSSFSEGKRSSRALVPATAIIIVIRQLAKHIIGVVKRMASICLSWTADIFGSVEKSAKTVDAICARSRESVIGFAGRIKSCNGG
jgi:hypothetical protein